MLPGPSLVMTFNFSFDAGGGGSLKSSTTGAGFLGGGATFGFTCSVGFFVGGWVTFLGGAWVVVGVAFEEWKKSGI
jgi:hypothetical protein